MEQWMASLVGGVIIGLASAGMLLFNGRITGISGMLGGVLLGPRETFRVAFVGGMLAAGLLLAWFAPAAFAAPGGRSLGMLALAGLLVGWGTRAGNGCTSGHGVCGLGRFSRRSGAATLTFMLTAAVTATSLQLLGVGS